MCTVAFFGTPAPSPVNAQEKTDDQRKAEAMDRELRRRDEEFHRDSSKRVVTQLMAKLERTTEMCATLDKSIDSFSSRMKALLTSDEGKKLAHDPAGFMNYMEIDKYPVATRGEIHAKRAAALSILETLRSEVGRVDIGFVPDDSTVDEADELYFWVKDRLSRLAAQEDRLRTIVEKAPVEVDLAKAKTLADAITDYHARWYELLGTSRILGEELSRPQSEKILVDAARAAELERAEAERDRLVREQRAEIERMKLEYEVKVLKLEKEQAERRVKAEQEFEDAKAELEALRKDAEAARLAKAIDAEIARDTKTSEAEKKLLVQRCQSAEVKRVLAPFLSEGYWQPGQKERGINKYPVSLSALRRVGALERNKRGLEVLLAIGVGKDKGGKRCCNDRPNLWGYYHLIDRLSAAQLEELKKAGDYLAELGEVMVELKMLAP